MKKIRNSVFETNSSSVHSIIIENGGSEKFSPISLKNGDIVFEGGEFGWGEDEIYGSYGKANYLAVYSLLYGIEEETKLLEEVLKEFTGCSNILYAFDTEDSYIDHQSVNWREVFKDKETLKEFIFNPKYAIKISHDNQDWGSCGYGAEKNSRTIMPYNFKI